MSTTRKSIVEAIESGNLLCDSCPMQGIKEGVFVGDIEVSEACHICGAVEGHMTGTTEDLIDAIGEDDLEYLAK
jgi:hypothetical protein